MGGDREEGRKDTKDREARGGRSGKGSRDRDGLRARRPADAAGVRARDLRAESQRAQGKVELARAQALEVDKAEHELGLLHLPVRSRLLAFQLRLLHDEEPAGDAAAPRLE